MTVFRYDQQPPQWCELKGFEIVGLEAGAIASRARTETRQRLLCTLGTVQIRHGSGTVVLKENQFLDLHDATPEQNWSVLACAPRAQLVSLSGAWGADISGCGTFRVVAEPNATHVGDPVTYPKATRVDPHYHDCDEYWIILEGRARVVVGNRTMDTGVGDCVPIGMGHHHDMPIVEAPVKAVFFETTLQGEKRIGHLWNHTHGPARPQPDRI
jgi:mannose-6-phosphate isomerase-like protein (cupin superfamily)